MFDLLGAETPLLVKFIIAFVIVSASGRGLATSSAVAVMIFGYIQLPDMLFGAGHYTVTVELPQSGGLYKNANVTYRGTEVGRVEEPDRRGAGEPARHHLARRR